MANAEFGNLDPNVFIQEDTRACFSTCLQIAADPERNLSESDISKMLIADDLQQEGIGTTLFPARVLDPTLNKLGMAVEPVYDARIRATGEPQLERARILSRLASVDQALRDEDTRGVILGFPMRREGQEPFLHFVVATGFTESSKGDGVVIVDPSDVDGGVRHPKWGELLKYATPAATSYQQIPVMAWAVKDAKGDSDYKFSAQVGDKGLPGFSLLAKPLFRPEDIGKSIPTDTDHACSVAMPTSDSTKQFASTVDISLSVDGEHPLGYPRFVIPPSVKELSLATLGKFSGLPFPTKQTAEAAVWPEKNYPTLYSPDPKDKEITERDGLFWLKNTQFNVEAWQHTGLGISSRQAAAHLEGRGENDKAKLATAEATIKQAITAETGAEPDDIYLFPTGMAAMYSVNQALIEAFDGKPSAQFGFPYTDTFEQRKYGPNKSPSSNLKDLRSGDYQELQDVVSHNEGLRGVFTEVPSNPLLWTPNLERLDRSLDSQTPIVIDDTIATTYNLDDSKLPDSVVARVTSLTKFFSSVGDVMGGSIVLRPDSPHYERVKEALDSIYEDNLWHEDATVLASHSSLFPEIMPTINKNAESLAKMLVEDFTGQGRPLSDVYHPSITSQQDYAAIKKPDAGYGGLMSLRFNSPKQAYKFFDELRVTKGPSLGTFYTLGCLYTWLAHKEMKPVEKFGVAPDLVRLSIGIEDISELQERAEEAFIASST